MPSRRMGLEDIPTVVEQHHGGGTRSGGGSPNAGKGDDRHSSMMMKRPVRTRTVGGKPLAAAPPKTAFPFATRTRTSIPFTTAGAYLNDSCSDTDSITLSSRSTRTCDSSTSSRCSSLFSSSIRSCRSNSTLGSYASAPGSPLNLRKQSVVLRKKVRFAVDQRGRPTSPNAYSPPQPPLTAEERKAYFFTNEDFKVFRKSCRKIVRKTQQSCYHDEFATLYEQCAASAGVESGDEGNNNNNDHDHHTDEQQHKEEDDYVVTGMPVVPTGIRKAAARGLEVVLFPALLEDRKLATQAVVRAQDKFPADMSWEQRADVLAATACLLSRQARLLATCMGLGDAETAREAMMASSSIATTTAASVATATTTSASSSPTLYAI